MEPAAFVTLWPAEMILGLARAELAEVLGRLGHDVGEELHLDAAEGFTWELESDKKGRGITTSYSGN